MAKAILIMDMPENCGGCELCIKNDEIDKWVCLVATSYPFVQSGYRSDTCPLIPAIGYVQPVGHMVSWEDESDE